MAAAQVSASLSVSIHDGCSINSRTTKAVCRLPNSSFTQQFPFAFGCSHSLRSSSSSFMKPAARATSVIVKCEQGVQGNTVDIWLGRLAMLGFATAISVEISTGKGLLENFGLVSPLPTLALALTGLIGVLTAIFIFQSASKN